MKHLKDIDNSKLVIETANRLDKIRKKVYVQSKSFDELISLAKRKEEMLRSVPAIIPISNKDLTRTASGYGWRIHPIYKIIKFHYGMDFTAPSEQKYMQPAMARLSAGSVIAERTWETYYH